MRTITAKIEWYISNLKKTYDDGYKEISTSDKFCDSSFPSVAWELRIKKVYKKYNYNIAIWLRQIGPTSINSLVNTKYKIYANSDGVYLDIANSTNKLENQEKLGYTEVDSNRLFDSSGSLHLLCEVEFDCNNKMINLQNTFRSMLEKETSTDFVIKVGDEVIKAHRCVLAQNSEVFQKMFEQNGMTEVLNGDVIISDYTPECVRAMLEFFLYWRS
ncbi:hypothetical protein ACQ4LE_011144 [Meloidogyne hapla]